MSWCSVPDECTQTQFQEDGLDKRIEIVPLEALKIEPNQVLVLRLPGAVTKEYVEEIRDVLRAAGVLDNRVIFMSGEVEATVIDA